MPDTALEPRAAYIEALEIMRTASDLGAASALLGWDQETYMPPAAAAARADQLSTLSAVTHSIVTSDRAVCLAEFFRDNLRHLNGELNDWEKRIARVFTRDVLRAIRLPETFVRRKTQVTALAQEAWKQARQQASFALFRDHLAQIIELAIEEAELRGYQDHRYNALLDLYEPGLTVGTLDPVFRRLEQATIEILRFVRDAGHVPDDSILKQHFPGQAQLAAAQSIIAQMGFDFSAGRVDLSAHPFCTSFAIADVRLTTRINERDLRSCLFGLIHEAGHGLYEQGMRSDLERTFARDGASMGIHESQSLFWENIIARSEEFWHWALPILRAYFPEQLSDVSPQAMYAAINRVEPSHYRIESDEVTYNLHIILRYRLEKAMLDGTLTADDIPHVWNALTEELLGLTVHNDAQGCLQDIHWSFGGIGYFPSYTLGKLYAAMLRSALLRAMPDAPDHVRRGDFSPIRQWLREVVHQWGRTMEPSELISAATGQPLSEEPFVAYVWEKVKRVYGQE